MKTLLHPLTFQLSRILPALCLAALFGLSPAGFANDNSSTRIEWPGNDSTQIGFNPLISWTSSGTPTGVQVWVRDLNTGQVLRDWKGLGNPIKKFRLGDLLGYDLPVSRRFRVKVRPRTSAQDWPVATVDFTTAGYCATNISHTAKNTTFLRTRLDPVADIRIAPDDRCNPANGFRLSHYGMQPGDWIYLTCDIPYSIAGPVTMDNLLAVFSSTSEILPRKERLRVPGAINAGVDFVTPRTHFDGFDTDIPEDFLVPGSGVAVQIPAGASYILISQLDTHFSDNGNGRVTIKKIDPAITYTAATTVSAMVGQSVNYAINYNTFSQAAVTISASGLPPGLSLGGYENSGGKRIRRIVGRPTRTGTYASTVTINNGASTLNQRVTFHIGAPEAELRYGSTVIPDGSTLINTGIGTEFGSIQVGAKRTRSFILRNTGTAPLTVSGLTDTSAQFTTAGRNASIPPGGQDSFAVTFSPTVEGSHYATIRIANSDSDENPYDFRVHGSAYKPSLSLSSTYQGVDFLGGIFSFTVRAIGSWTYKILGSWISSQEALTQNGNQTFTYSVESSHSDFDRFGEIQFESEDGTTESHFINQSGVIDDYPDTIQNAALVSLGSKIDGKIESTGDVDAFEIRIFETGLWTLQSRGPLDIVVTVKDGSGNVIGARDDSGPNILSLFPGDVDPGTYYIEVHASSPTATGNYALVQSFEPSARNGRPDALIGRPNRSLFGDGIYNTTGTGQTSKASARIGRTPRFSVVVQNDGDADDRITLHGTGRKKRFRPRYFDLSAGGANVTALVTTTGWGSLIRAGESKRFELRIKPTSRLRGRFATCEVRAQSGSGGEEDVVHARVRRRGR